MIFLPNAGLVLTCEGANESSDQSLSQKRFTHPLLFCIAPPHRLHRFKDEHPSGECFELVRQSEARDCNGESCNHSCLQSGSGLTLAQKSDGLLVLYLLDLLPSPLLSSTALCLTFRPFRFPPPSGSRHHSSPFRSVPFLPSQTNAKPKPNVYVKSTPIESP